MSSVGTSAARVLVVGDANPDLILRGDVVPRFGQAEQLLDEATLTIGGSAAITACAFARLGRPVSLIAAVGDDDFGARMCRDLCDAGVALDLLVRRADVPTGLTVVLSANDDRAILTLPGCIPTLSKEDVVQALTQAGPARHLHVSSLFLQPHLAPALPDLFAQVRSRGMTTSLDTNDDPSGLWQGLSPVLAHVDVLLPNRAEVIALGRNSDPRRAAAQLAAEGPLVVVKNGKDGGFAVTPFGQFTEVAGEPRAAVDTTGAGDTFNAAFLDGWLNEQPLGDCVHRAVHAGALAVSAVGGTAGQPSSDDLITFGRTHDN